MQYNITQTPVRYTTFIIIVMYILLLLVPTIIISVQSHTRVLRYRLNTSLGVLKKNVYIYIYYIMTHTTYAAETFSSVDLNQMVVKTIIRQ